MTHLAKFMADHSLSDDDVAKAISRSRVTVSRIRRRIVRPDWSTIEKLKVMSGGAITADDFQEKPDPVPAEAAQ